jgi:hypothetical protein
MAYTDLTSGFFTFEKLLPYQYLNLLAANDAFDHFAGATAMMFPQATAPIGWVRQESIDDSFIRVVDSFVGSGGSDGLTTGLNSINHSHSTPVHNHTIGPHIHNFNFSTTTAAVSAVKIITDGGSPGRMYSDNAGGSTAFHLFNRTSANAGGNVGDAAPGTNATLTNTIFKYVDTLFCIKGT